MQCDERYAESISTLVPDVHYVYEELVNYRTQLKQNKEDGHAGRLPHHVTDYDSIKA